ncbi:hypothetical protein Hanom_Chr06g00538711 [Helianthus anomalus]
MFIQQTKHPLDIYDTMSRLCTDETRKINQARNAAQAIGTPPLPTKVIQQTRSHPVKTSGPNQLNEVMVGEIDGENGPNSSVCYVW